MRIAIIGAGVSGLVAAARLHLRHDVTVFEGGDHVGGHVNTVDVEAADGRFAVDTGFIVFNDRTYPNFVRLLRELGTDWQPAPMSFSVRCDRTGLEYRGADLNGLFAQRRNLVRPRFYRLLRDLLRFQRQTKELLDAGLLDEEETVASFFAAYSYSPEFREQYFLPMASAIWSCPRAAVHGFPMRFILEFYRNHGLLGVRDMPEWRVVRGGSKSYIEALTQPFRQRIRTRSRVIGVTRRRDGVTLRLHDGRVETFDHVVFACHSDQALRILGDQATATEREILAAFPYERNVAVLHTDTSLLPQSRRAWACWNYRLPSHDPGQATVTYNMNLLQGLKSRETYCVTLNGERQVAPGRVLNTFVYHHPVFNAGRTAAQRRHGELLLANRSSFCGAYWGNGFHEDGVVSALAVCRALSRARPTIRLNGDSSGSHAPEPNIPAGLAR